MSSEDVGLKVSTLNGIHSLITDTPQSVIEHVPALVPRLLQLAKDPTSMVCTKSQTNASNVMTISLQKVRIGSLSCIGSLTTLPTHIVSSHTCLYSQACAIINFRLEKFLYIPIHYRARCTLIRETSFSS